MYISSTLLTLFSSESGFKIKEYQHNPKPCSLVARLFRINKMTKTSKMTNKKLIKAAGKILVNENAESVFSFFANPANDNLWRKEINKSTLDGPLQPGVTVSENSYLSKKAPNNLIVLKCIQFDKNKLAIFETPDNAQFYLRSQREVKAVSESTTEIIYMVAFDSDIVKYALGFALPKFIVSFKANSDMKKYLRKLKALLEFD